MVELTLHAPKLVICHRGHRARANNGQGGCKALIGESEEAEVCVVGRVVGGSGVVEGAFPQRLKSRVGRRSNYPLDLLWTGKSLARATSIHRTPR